MAVNRLSLAGSLASVRQTYITLPFYKDGCPLEDPASGPRWGMSLRSAGSMRFRWNEQNPRREAFLSGLCGGSRQPLAVELIHSKIVHDVKNAGDGRSLQNLTGDGLITADPTLVPVVTVADCMPLFLYDASGHTGVFGAFHSGWKGTGIIGVGIEKAEKNYGARREDLSVAIGAHIQGCCYVVDDERAAYFADNFTPAAVRPLQEFNGAGKRLYSLSLLEANLAVLKAAGLRDCNIVAATDCTCCSCLQGAGGAYFPFGSFRRQAAFMPPELDADRRSRLMTVQAAFCMWR